VSHYNLGKRAPGCQTILYFGASRDNEGGGWAENGTPTRLKLHPVSLQPPVYQHSVFTGQIPFARRPTNIIKALKASSHTHTAVYVISIASHFADVAVRSTVQMVVLYFTHWPKFSTLFLSPLLSLLEGCLRNSRS